MSELVRLSLDRAGEEKEKIMDFALTDEQELLVESLKEYADRYFDDESVRQMYENHQVSAEAQDAYRDAGFPFMGLPEEVGGIPTDHVTLGLMTEKLVLPAVQCRP